MFKTMVEASGKESLVSESEADSNLSPHPTVAPAFVCSPFLGWRLPTSPTGSHHTHPSACPQASPSRCLHPPDHLGWKHLLPRPLQEAQALSLVLTAPPFPAAITPFSYCMPVSPQPMGLSSLLPAPSTLTNPITIHSQGLWKCYLFYIALLLHHWK